LLLVLVAACRTVRVADTSMTGAATPRAAVDRFLAAARAQDIQALTAVFGNERGALREQSDRSTMEKQALIMLQCLRHDQESISEPRRAEAGHQNFMVTLTQGKLSGTALFTVTRGPGDRWFVLSFDIVSLQNKGFCSKPAG
jgi:hypothetical protein